MATTRNIALMLVTLAHPLQASAFVLRHSDEGALIRWKSADVSVRIDRAFSRGNRRGAEAIESAFGTWESIAGNPFRMRVDRSERDLGSGAREDGNADVILVRRDWTFDERYLAITLVTYLPGSGQIIDADILVNSVQHEFIELSHRADAYDLGSVLTHEVGHVWGLGHSALADATMYDTTVAGTTEKRTLEADDVDGFTALYLTDGYALDAGGCRQAGPGSGAASALAPLLLVTALVARRGRGRQPARRAAGSSTQ